MAIGGVGGSGTRVFAEIFREFGFYLGDCLNKPLDNLWFTVLFKRPHWFSRNRGKNEEEIYRAIRLFNKTMTRGLASTVDPDEIIYIRNAGKEILAYPYKMGVNHLQTENILKSKPPDSSKYIGWGWKEPNTHVFLRYLATFFPDFRYIHVLRHGLDMAYSTNHQQFLNWGTLIGSTAETNDSATPQNLLRYWIEANNQAVELGRALLGERFLVIRLEDLCRYPEASIKRMARFVGVDVDEDKLDQLSQLPILPGSSDRYRNHRLRAFTAKDLEAVKSFGYEIRGWKPQPRYTLGLAKNKLKQLVKAYS